MENRWNSLNQLFFTSEHTRNQTSGFNYSLSSGAFLLSCSLWNKWGLSWTCTGTCARPECPLCSPAPSWARMNNTCLCFRVFIAFSCPILNLPHYHHVCKDGRGKADPVLSPDGGQWSTKLSMPPPPWLKSDYFFSLTGNFPRAQISSSCHRTKISVGRGGPSLPSSSGGPWELPSPSSWSELRESEAGNRWWGRLASPHAYFIGFAASHLLIIILSATKLQGFVPWNVAFDGIGSML